MWRIISSKEVFTHPRLSLIEDEVMLPNGNKTKYLKFKDDGHCAVTIIAKRNDGKILLQTEYSYPSNQDVYQFPGGFVPDGEQPEIGANRELMEEVGLMSNHLELLGSYLVNNRRSATKMHVYLATDLQEKSLPGDQEEDIKSFWFTEDEIDQMIANNEIINCHAMASWCLYRCQKIKKIN